MLQVFGARGGDRSRAGATFGGTNWDIHPAEGHDMRLVVNWFEELRAIEGR